MASSRRVQGRALTVLLLLILFAGSAFAQALLYPGATWTRTSTPEQLGWSPEKLNAAKAYAATINTAALMIVVDGRVLDEWGETGKRFNVHSIRKSFLSALYGIQVRDGRIQLSKTLADLGIDDRGSLTTIERGATVADLLKARSGIYHPALYETQEMAVARPARGSYSPGTFWYYNNSDFNALGTIYEQETKASIFEEFKSRIADPLEMEDFRIADGSYV
jgi:CubicO group peptidase (beta-lactamase class C family)